MRDTLFAVGLLLSPFSFVAGAQADSPFTPCEDTDGIAVLANTQCALIKTPLAHQSGAEKPLDLFVRRFAARQPSQGTVWLIAGGPGESGASFYSQIDTFRNAFAHYDLMIPDHRGTGYSSTICPQESPDSTGGTALVGEEWGACFGHMYGNVDYVKAFSITHAAKDLARLIDAYSGDGKRYVYGVSYGTQLTLRLLQLDGVQLDGVILDSLVPMQNDARYDLSQRSDVVNQVGLQVLKRCDTAKGCGGEKPLAEVLAKVLESGPLLSDHAPELPQARLSDTLGMLLDIPALRSRLPELITTLDAGDASVLKAVIAQAQGFYADFNQGYANFGSSIPLVQVISSSENNLRPQLTKEQVAKEDASRLFTSPLPGLLAGNSMPTYSQDAFYAALPKRFPPILVLQGTLDPKTPYQGAFDYVKALNKQGDVELVDVVDVPHFVALHAPACFEQAAGAFTRGEKTAAQKCRTTAGRLGF